MPTLTDPARAIEVRQQLARREAELRSLLDACTLGAMQDADEREVGDFKDMAVAEVQATVDEAQAAHVVAELQRLQAARGRLDEGSYGFCEECGDEIDPRRLAALPTTTHCASCQEWLERRAARTH
ncbi:TraR/DksA family transcriptional regulator [Ramlibacter tataouinensis]|uniref:TraR/DksA family transcriptional regulator n=1 Tax=Ramlibacter tataouinensis TaxID=94132 RepID=UPI0022F3FB22|nr:TraR/DksA family transcriptional regulator [Ramlibacter tataouinensis]WBY02667.1 TraR/DksA family transcriptional regulator [Ramlibacter tataouinensis]